MITVIDRTLSLLPAPKDGPSLRALVTELFSVGADAIEISEDCYALLGRDFPMSKIILRLNPGSSPAAFKGVKRFVSSGSASGNVVMSEEYFVKNPEMLSAGSVPPVLRPVRLSLATPSAAFDIDRTFTTLRNVFLGHIEFSPCGDAGIATSVATEWILSEGNCVVTTLGGVCGYPSLEEVLIFLASVRRRRPLSGGLTHGERMKLLSLAYPGVDCPDDASCLKVSSNSSIHVLKFKLEQIGFGKSPDRARALAGAIRAGSRFGSDFIGSDEIAALDAGLN